MCKKRIYQRIIAVALCFAMLFGIIHMENFIHNDISATDSAELKNEVEPNSTLTYEEIEQEILNRVEESNKAEDLAILNFTWRETTAERFLYYNDYTISNIGKEYFGETIEEIIQMSKDSSIEFDEENFFNGTPFEGITIDDLLWLQEEGYTLQDLSEKVSDNGNRHIYEYLYGISLFSSTDEIYGKTSYNRGITGKRYGQYAVIIPSLNRGFYNSAKPFWFIQINEHPAFCLDLGKSMSEDKWFTLTSNAIVNEEAKKIINAALKYHDDKLAELNGEYNTNYYNATSDAEREAINEQYDTDRETLYSIIQIYVWSIMACYEPTSTVPAAGTICKTCNEAFVQGDVYCEDDDGYKHHAKCLSSGIPQVYYTSKKCDVAACTTVLTSGDKWLQDIAFQASYCYRCDLQKRTTEIKAGDNYYFHDSPSEPQNGLYYDLWSDQIFCENCYNALTDGTTSGYTYDNLYLTDEFRYTAGPLESDFDEFMVKRAKIYCEEHAHEAVNTVFYDAFFQYQTCVDLITMTGNTNIINDWRPIEIIRRAGSSYALHRDEYMTVIDAIWEIRSEGTAEEANIYYRSDYYQRLATYAGPIPKPDPEPDIEIKWPEITYYESKMYVIHNINGVINQSTGKGVVASWNKASAPNNSYNWRTDATTKQSYCGTDYGAKEYTYSFDFYQAQHTSEADAIAKIKEYVRNELMQDDYKVSISGPTTYVYETNDELDTKYTHYVYTATLKMFDTEAHVEGITHTIYKPLVRNYKMTINYQGGWVDDLSTTTELGAFNNNASSFDVTHTGNTTFNKTSIQTTNVTFADMKIKTAHKFNTSVTASPYKKGTLTATDPNGKYYQYIHGENIGVTEMIEFTYNGYYAVYLPTPERTGYNFLYYTDANGNKVEPTTLEIDGVSYDVYIFDDAKCSTHYTKVSDTLYSYELYANWELITKDETITVHWLDNSNNYTTRPESIYLELYRYTEDGETEICEKYITENISSSSNDWITRFSNETGITSDGNSTGGTKTTGIFDPNVYLDTSGTANSENNIFEANGNYYIKVSGDNENPANTNSWTVKLKNLQKYDTYSEDWQEYTYVVKQVTCESLDDTVAYYTSPNKLHNNYSTSMSKYYNMKYDDDTRGNAEAESGQGTYNEYKDLDIKGNFSKTIVNRAGNVAGPSNWKNIVVSATFEDGPQNEVTVGINDYNDDVYHFRPYELKINLYQNYAYGIDSSTNNFLADTGVRVLYKEQFITQPFNPLSSTIPASGFMANTLRYTFLNVPTVQDSTCIKIAYDVILTHAKDEYRYTIEQGSDANNLDDKYASSKYYANKHKDITTTVTDLDYTKMYSSSLNKTLYVIDTIYKEITQVQYNALSADEKTWSIIDTSSGVIKYYTPDFSKIDTSKYIYKAQILEYREQRYGAYNFISNADQEYVIYQDYLKQENDNHIIVGQNNIYENYPGDYYGPGTITYPDTYKSMAYNLRYYYIDEGRYMNATASYYVAPLTASVEKRTEYLTFKETLYWNFTLTLNHKDTPLPEEYTGSSSEDDRTGNYTGDRNDDFTFTNNVISITNKVYSDDNHTITASDPDYDKLLIDIEHEDFLITFKQVQKIWNNQGHNVTESYNNDKYSINGYMYINNGTTMKVSYKSNTDVIDNAVGVGNDYNIIVPANGSVILDYLPDGKYEITCHYDIDFDSFDFSFEGTTGTATFTEENGKHYVTLSSKDVLTEGTITHVATIDYWRGYVNDQNNNNSVIDNIYRGYITYQSSLR